MNWTIDRVKHELPDVKVRLGDGTVVDGQLSGRRSEYPTVTIKVHGSSFAFRVSWFCATDAVERDRPIIY